MNKGQGNLNPNKRTQNNTCTQNRFEEISKTNSSSTARTSRGVFHRSLQSPTTTVRDRGQRLKKLFKARNLMPEARVQNIVLSEDESVHRLKKKVNE